MAIWISRYSNKELQSGKYYPVGISIGTPKFPLGYTLRKQCYSLAPKGYMLNMELDRFKPAYYEKLEGIGTDRIIDMVEKMNAEARAEGKELVLLCYEDVRVPGDWCHRTVFAEWWAEQTGELIEELYQEGRTWLRAAEFVWFGRDLIITSGTGVSSTWLFHS